MPLSSFALILGVVCYVFGFPLLFSSVKATAWRKQILKSEFTLRFIGVICAVLAALSLKHQWYLTPDADGLVVTIAWVILVKGVILAWWPNRYIRHKMRFEKWMTSSDSAQLGSGILLVFFGALFTYLGVIMI